MLNLPKLFALIQSNGPGGTDKETICFHIRYASVKITILGCMWFLSCTSGIMGAQVYTHAHALQQPDQCSSVIGGASCSGLQVPNVWEDGRGAGRGSVYKRTRMRSKNRILAHRSIDGPASPEYFKDDE